MYEHKKIKWILTDCLDEMYSEGWRLAYYDKEVQISVWDREIKKKRTPAKPKEPQKAVTTYFSELVVKGHCSFYKDLENQYFEWIKRRADNDKKKFVQFNESSEKSAWKKLWQFPKPVAERMLEAASAQAYGMIYDLSDWEISKIMEPLRQAQQKEEIKREWFSTDEEKKQAEVLKWRIEDYIKSHPQLKQEAVKHVTEKLPNLVWKYKEKAIDSKIRMMANNIINK